jgi:pimeloyl-ACP methyl ester carboxylesterase
MPGTVRSSDEVPIAFERTGDGPPLIIVDGAIAYREVGPSGKLARELSHRFTVYRYDRRGRGQSGDTSTYSIGREIDDIQALIERAGAPASLVGLSSGAVLALDAANQGLAVTKVVAYEAPFIVDASRTPAPTDYRQQLERLLGNNRPGDAVKLFMGFVGLPRVLIATMPLFPAWKKLKAAAPTLVYDATIMEGTQAGRPLPTDRWAAAQLPVLVADGAKSPAWLHRASDAAAAILPIATRRGIDGANHMAQAGRVAPVVASFLADSPTSKLSAGRPR